MVDPPVSVQGGLCIAGLNYESDTSGYRRFAGYERYDGRPQPHKGADAAEIATRRGDIDAVPGGGPVRGVWMHKGTLYAIRDRSDGLVGRMYKATSTGWQQVDLGSHIAFKESATEIGREQVITGQASGATARVKRPVLQANGSAASTWTSGNGYLALSEIVGTFQDNEIITTPEGGSAKIDGAITANTLQPGGLYRFEAYNFYGSFDRGSFYGVSGVDRAFEYDGETFTPIFTGVDGNDDKPTSLGILRNHLFLGYSGGSVLHSEIGNPLAWQVIGGAGEIGFGDQILDMKDSFNTTLMVIGDQRIGYVSGSSALDFALEVITDEAGGLGGTAQNIGSMIYVDQLGIRDISSTQAFGNFKRGALSRSVAPLFEDLSSNPPLGSIRVRSRDLYRLFMADNTVVSVYVGRSNPEIMRLQLPFTFSCGCDVDFELKERTFIGATNGYVYEMDVGTSMDGEAVQSFIRLPYLHFGAPTQNKCFYKADLQIHGPQETQLSLAAEYDYGSPDQPSAIDDSVTVFAGGGFWDQSNWDEFLWSSQVIGTASADMDGFGANASIVIATGEDSPPHTLADVTIFYSMRGLAR